jgi:RHS repeat-associated protein
VYESTLNSGGYYHVNASYWANGRLDVLNGGSTPLPGLPAITYGASDGTGLDGEGRITKVNASSGQNPVTSVGYNVAQQVTGVTFGSADSDAYQYDVNTGRMTKYTFNMGAGPTTQVGTLTWNKNGTLGTLQIADQINTANSQTCTFVYDDLVRITSANCGTVWSQTFGLDPFGNLTKSGSGQFLPMYNMAKNQYSSIPGGSTTAYDANGNLTNDVTHSYTWDADGNMLSTDGTTVTMIYDGLDRMIEQTRGSAHTQIVYGPYGLKLALMNGQTLVNAFVKLPGGARAVYNSSGLAYYRHSDHLGSSRLATTPSRTKQYDVAYAPYGEDYDGSGTQDLAFTDQNQDTVKNGWSTNLYDFMFREYRTAHGRWTSPDPAGLGAVDPANPQSWNRYAYALNNPTSLIDPLGLSTNTVTTWDGNCFTSTTYYYDDNEPGAGPYDWNSYSGCVDPSTLTLQPARPPSTPPPNTGGQSTDNQKLTDKQKRCIAQQVANQQAIAQNTYENAGKALVWGGVKGFALGAVAGCRIGFVGGEVAAGVETAGASGPVGCLVTGGAFGFFGGIAGAGSGAIDLISYFAQYSNLPVVGNKFLKDVNKGIQASCKK